MIGEGPVTRARKALAKKLLMAQKTAKDSGQPFDLGSFTGSLSDDERDLMGLPPQKATPQQVGATAAGLAPDYPTAGPSELTDFAKALFGNLPPVPFDTGGPASPLSVTPFGPKSLGPTAAQLSQQRAEAFQTQQTQEAAARQKESEIANTATQVANVTGLDPEQAKTVAGYFHGAPAQGPLPRNLKALADFSESNSRLQVNKALYLERLANMAAADAEGQNARLRLLHELEKNPQLDQAISLLKDIPGAASDQLKAILATKVLQSAGLLAAGKEVTADPKGLPGIFQFIFGGLAQKAMGTELKPGDVTVPTPALPSATNTPPVDQGSFQLPTDVRRQVGITAEPPAVAPTPRPVATPTPTARRPESDASMNGFSTAANAIIAGRPIRLSDGSIGQMSLVDLTKSYIAQYDVPQDRADKLLAQATDIDSKLQAKNATSNKKAAESAAHETIAHQILTNLSSAKDVAVAGHKLSEIAGEHGAAILRAAPRAALDVAKRRAKEAIAKELADGIITFLKARRKAREQAKGQ